MPMKLQKRCGQHRRHRAFDHSRHAVRLSGSGRNEDDASRVQDRRHSHRQRLMRHGAHSPEERRVGAARRGSQARGVSSRHERARRLVESDVTIRAETEELHVDAADALDRALVPPAFALDVVGRAV
jgi:hypothetical protein